MATSEAPVQMPRGSEGYAAKPPEVSVNVTTDIPAQLRRRRAAALKLPRLEDGRRDPWHDDYEVTPVGPGDPCGPSEYVDDPVTVVRLTCSTHKCRVRCMFADALGGAA